MPDVLASTANLLKVERLEGRPAVTARARENFQVMREWNRAEIYRKALVLMSEKIGE